jgi:hypothetical protein
VSNRKQGGRAEDKQDSIFHPDSFHRQKGAGDEPEREGSKRKVWKDSIEQEKYWNRGDYLFM